MWRCECLLLTICTKCCVIKPFFYLHFFFWFGSLRCTKRQGGTIKPASASHVGSVAFLPLWAPHSLPGEGGPPSVPPGLPSAFPGGTEELGFPWAGGPAAGQGCVRARAPSATWAPSRRGGAGLGAPAWAVSQNGCPVGRLASAPPCRFLLTAAQPCPQGWAEEAAQPGALGGGRTGSFKKGPGACPFLPRLAVCQVRPACWP